MAKKKKRSHPGVEEVLARPWCYYCERDFDDLKILISHQKAKHFKCEKCGKRLNTPGGLGVHSEQVHKEKLMEIENALPTRKNPNIEIFGTEGIPEDIMQQHNQRVLAAYYAAEAERQTKTGNPAPGLKNDNRTKKPKFEDPEELKRRLAEHKAKKDSEQNGGGGVEESNSPAPLRQAGSPPFSQNQSQFSGPQQGSPPSVYASSFQQPPFQQSFQQTYPQQGLGPPGNQFPAGFPPQQTGAASFQPPFAGNLPARPPSYGGPNQNDYLSQYQAPESVSAQATSVDDLISSVTKELQAGSSNSTPKPAEQPVEKKPKKEKDKGTRLMYADNETSPEEKMAKLPKYAFTPDSKEQTMLGNVSAAVTGIAVGQDDVVDKTS